MLLRKIKGIMLVFMICALFTVAAFNIGAPERFINTAAGEIHYILDAGHGAPDGGTVGADGTAEAELNFAITQKLSSALSKKNISHMMTRNGEESIYSEGKTIHEKKVSDVRNRIRIASETPTIPLVSIHMNSYPDASVYGIQVFYGNGDKAQSLAGKLQSALNESLQPDHGKVAKEVSKNVYLFSHIDNPVILIECGFLSNGDELKKLKDENYQQKLASIIAEVLAE